MYTHYISIIYPLYTQIDTFHRIEISESDHPTDGSPLAGKASGKRRSDDAIALASIETLERPWHWADFNGYFVDFIAGCNYQDTPSSDPHFTNDSFAFFFPCLNMED